jgi:hypothetical protein
MTNETADVPDVEAGEFLALTAEDVATRYQDSRPGFRLADFDYVGLPVYRLDVDASFLDAKRISPIDEFVLRSIDAGLRSAEEIQQFLGLDARIVKRSMVSLARSEDIGLQASPGDARQVLRLTDRGRATVAEWQRVVPTDHKVFVYYDGLLRKPVAVGPERPLHPKDMRSLGMREIPPIPSKPPALEDLRPREVFEVLKAAWSGAKRSKELLAIKGIERRQRFYRRAVALIYRSVQGNEVQVAFALDGRLSLDHERAFALNKGPEKTGILSSVLDKSGEEKARLFIGPATAEAALPLSKSEQLRGQLAAAQAALSVAGEAVAGATTSDARQAAEERQNEAERAATAAQAALEAPKSRMIGVLEHPPLLREALTSSVKRMVIVSPWIRAAVVDRTFLRRLEERLRRGVEVYIGYGLGQPEQEARSWADEEAEKALEGLADRYRTLILRRFGDTHAKVLICDNRFCVATSFNWLSFRGDPKRAFREELGFLVKGHDEVEESFQLVVKRFGSALR